MKLRKELGLIHVFCIASGAMISSGIFILPGLAYAQAGPAVILSYLIAGFLATTGMLSVAELATAMPKAGGDYFFITRGMGPGVGSVAGLLTWFSLSLKTAFALVGMAAFTSLYIDVDMRVLGVLLCTIFVAVNICGTKHAGWMQVGLVSGLLLLMLFYVVRGLPAVSIMRLEPFAPHGPHSIFLTAGFVFVAYGGLLKISSVAEEVKDPGRVIPLGMILSLLIVSISYTLMVLVTAGVLPADKLSNSLTPISDGAAVFMGPSGRVAIGLAAMLAFISTANAGIMAASRYLLALSRDELLPKLLGRVNARFQTPHVAILVTGGFIAAALFLKLKILVEAASLVLLLGYILSSACVIIMRESRIQNYQPRFRSPLYPWPQLIGITGFTFLIFEMGVDAFFIAAGLIGVGSLTYWLYGRKRVEHEFALLHLIARITSRDLVTGTLETELKQIIRERDELVLDRFDHLVTACPVLDIERSMTKSDFFGKAAEALADTLDLAPGKIERLLEEREQQSSTVLSAHFALPHVVIKGEHRFEILLVRCREGIHFSAESPEVTCAFVLMGTVDERNFHLHALANIAQIVRGADFDKKWMAARGEQGLRDLVLLGERRREA